MSERPSNGDADGDPANRERERAVGDELPTIRVPEGRPPITPEMVRAALDED